MDIQEVKEKRIQLESDIKTLVYAFEDETKTQIGNLGLIRHTAKNGMDKVIETQIEIFVNVEV